MEPDWSNMFGSIEEVAADQDIWQSALRRLPDVPPPTSPARHPRRGVVLALGLAIVATVAAMMVDRPASTATRAAGRKPAVQQTTRVGPDSLRPHNPFGTAGIRISLSALRRRVSYSVRLPDARLANTPAIAGIWFAPATEQAAIFYRGSRIRLDLYPPGSAEVAKGVRTTLLGGAPAVVLAGSLPQRGSSWSVVVFVDDHVEVLMGQPRPSKLLTVAATMAARP